MYRIPNFELIRYFSISWSPKPSKKSPQKLENQINFPEMMKNDHTLPFFCRTIFPYHITLGKCTEFVPPSYFSEGVYVFHNNELSTYPFKWNLSNLKNTINSEPYAASIMQIGQETPFWWHFQFQKVMKLAMKRVANENPTFLIKQKIQ